MRQLLAITLALVLAGLAGAARAAEPLVDAAWIKANLGTPGVAFLDVRGPLGGASKAHYQRAHIPGAIYSDYLKDGWRIKDKNGTVGMLPPAGRLEQLIGGLGIANDFHVVVVANGTSALDMGTAARIYWTFKVLGHDEVSVLDGGMAAYLRARDQDEKPVNPLEPGPLESGEVKAAAHHLPDHPPRRFAGLQGTGDAGAWRRHRAGRQPPQQPVPGCQQARPGQALRHAARRQEPARELGHGERGRDLPGQRRAGKALCRRGGPDRGRADQFLQYRPLGVARLVRLSRTLG